MLDAVFAGIIVPSPDGSRRNLPRVFNVVKAHPKRKIKGPSPSIFAACS
jgi:hypothetical protein